ncbi:MAG: hypothetical protein P4L46_13195 [Fimbriimonas sp.]|nr:hypothetical protein [Fimbriimonas sp.]
MVVAALAFAQFQISSTIEAKLKHELSGLKGVAFSRDSDTLVVRYRTHIVHVQRQTKMKPVKREHLPEEQPTLTGFKLETYDFDHKATDPPRFEQAVRTSASYLRDYGSWKMDSVDRQIEDADRARYYYLEWGNRADPKVIAAIRRALESGTRPIGHQTSR